MLDRTFIVPQPEVPSKHTLENLLPNLKAATVQTLDTILSLEDTSTRNLQAFVEPVKFGLMPRGGPKFRQFYFKLNIQNQ
ncbi:hypothetical protein FGO68_gene9566 [Halteria grandinella]|uniref:Uncharacterized protein n=1 Tax=Halteria grandinella TaxID=5974 RepID=A0A8J8NBN4_HALGN|nr:hypothetical protein FGO68_gene9566 [Halteria grandinella]